MGDGGRGQGEEGTSMKSKSASMLSGRAGSMGMPRDRPCVTRPCTAGAESRAEMCLRRRRGQAQHSGFLESAEDSGLITNHLIERSRRLFRVYDGWLVSKVVEVSCSNLSESINFWSRFKRDGRLCGFTRPGRRRHCCQDRR